MVRILFVCFIFFNRKNTHKINSAKAAMSDLAKIREELFWVFLKEEVGDFGVLQAPRPTAVGHNGERGAMSLSPGTIWVCDSDSKAPTDGSSAGQVSHMCSAERQEEKIQFTYTLPVFTVSL